jgi:hypothetical protein
MNFYFIGFITDHVRAEIALSVSGDMASINRIKAENRDDISHLATPAETRFICMHMVKDHPLSVKERRKEKALKRRVFGSR